MSNWKMKCIDYCGDDYTTGKIYEVVDGKFKNDDGMEIKTPESFEKWNRYSHAKWELIEEPKQALEVECYNIENVVLFKVLHQDDSKIERGKFGFIASNGIQIDSLGYENITERVIAIRGSKDTREKILNCEELPSIDRAQELVKKVHQAVAELNESLADKPKGRWKPVEGEEYFAIDVMENCEHFVWTEKSRLCNKNWEKNNVFQTEKEAERKREIFDKLYELRYEFSLEEWEDIDFYEHIITYNHRNKELLVGTILNIQYATHYFRTEEDAQEFIDFCGKDDYVKYVLGVY